MVDLILFGLFIALFIGAAALGLSAGLAWFAAKMLPRVFEETLAFVTAGLLPVGLAFLTFASFFWPGDCCETGPEAQGLLSILIVVGALILIGWPLGYKINLSIIGTPER